MGNKALTVYGGTVADETVHGGNVADETVHGGNVDTDILKLATKLRSLIAEQCNTSDPDDRKYIERLQYVLNGVEKILRQQAEK